MTTLDDARRELREFLTDMAALRTFADPLDADAAPFTAAFAVARERALRAAEAYVAMIATANGP